MRNYLALVGKELHTLFVSPVAYVVLAVFYAITGIFFYLILANVIESSIQAAFRAQQFGTPPPPFDAAFAVSSNFFAVLSTFLLFLIPMITMAVFAEEKRRGTIELLFTSPITHAQLILGKFTALLVFLTVMLGPTILNSLLVHYLSEPPAPLAPMLIGYLGAFLLGGALLAIGVFLSTVTENQIVAAFTTWGAFITLWIIDAAADSASTLYNETLRYLSILNHYQDFTRGVLDTQHVVFYLSFIVLGLFLTSVSLDTGRWRE